MSNSYFRFKQFTINQDKCAMKVTTDACLFGAIIASELSKSEKPNYKMLDIGTGTGLLSLMVAQKTSSIINAIEIDRDTSEQAYTNFHSSPWASRLTIFFEDVKKHHFTTLYDVIFSNPPFYENELTSPNKKRNTALHEEGLLLSELAAIIQKNMAAGGRFFLLVPYKRKTEIESLLNNNGLEINRFTFVRQTSNHEYFRIIIEGNRAGENNQPVLTDDLFIKNNSDEYSPEFVALLKDYYLYLD